MCSFLGIVVGFMIYGVKSHFRGLMDIIKLMWSDLKVLVMNIATFYRSFSREYLEYCQFSESTICQGTLWLRPRSLLCVWVAAFLPSQTLTIIFYGQDTLGMMMITCHWPEPFYCWRMEKFVSYPWQIFHKQLLITGILFFWQIFITLSCTIAVGTNLSQFICIGRFTAVSFQVLGHMKTILVLILGFIFFGKEGLNLHVVLGMIIAVVGMIWYGNASSKPGGKERKSLSLPKQQKNVTDSSELDSKV